MKLLDALNTLGIKSTKTLDKKEVKKAFHLACMKYHPDRNPAGNEMMKMVLQAWEVLQKENFPINCEGFETGDCYDYGKEINDALNKIVGIEGIQIEVCGSWVWVSNTRYDQRSIFCLPRQYDPETKKPVADDEIRFRWSRDKKRWYFRPANQQILPQIWRTSTHDGSDQS